MLRAQILSSREKKLAIIVVVLLILFGIIGYKELMPSASGNGLKLE